MEAKLALLFLPLVAAISTDDLMPLGGLSTMQNMNLPNMNNLGSNMNPMVMQQGGNYGGNMAEPERIPCSCGIFLNGQFRRASLEQPRGNAALLQELVEPYPCTPIGDKQCTNKCLETVSYLYFHSARHFRAISAQNNTVKDVFQDKISIRHIKCSKLVVNL